MMVLRPHGKCYLQWYTPKKGNKEKRKLRERLMAYMWADLEWISVVAAARTDGLPVCAPLASPDSNSNPCCRWLKFEEDVEDGGERWSKPYVATLSLHSLFELRCCIMNSTVMLDMRANTIEEIAGNIKLIKQQSCTLWCLKFFKKCIFKGDFCLLLLLVV